MDDETYFECPHCQSHWGIEEIDWQQCDACGWPDIDLMQDSAWWYDEEYPRDHERE